MENLHIPLKITPKGLQRDTDLKESIDSFLEVLITTQQFQTPADPLFGFVFNNMKFEIFDERSGVIYDSGDTGEGVAVDGLYGMKVSGDAKDIGTFASLLKKDIEREEQRLRDVNVTMSYTMKVRQVTIHVEAIIDATDEPYKFDYIMKVWK